MSSRRRGRALRPSLFFNDTPTPEIYTLSLHDALPISGPSGRSRSGCRPRPPSSRSPITAASFPAASGEFTERAVALRLARQHLLTRPDPPQYWVVLDETVPAQSQCGGLSADFAGERACLAGSPSWAVSSARSTWLRRHSRRRFLTTGITGLFRQWGGGFQEPLERGEVARHRRLDPWNRQRAERPQQYRRWFQLNGIGEPGPARGRLEQVAGRGLEGADLPLDGEPAGWLEDDDLEVFLAGAGNGTGLPVGGAHPRRAWRGRQGALDRVVPRRDVP